MIPTELRAPFDVWLGATALAVLFVAAVAVLIWQRRTICVLVRRLDKVEARHRFRCWRESEEIARRVRAEGCARQRNRRVARLMTRARLVDGHGQGRIGREWAAWRGN